MSYPHAVATGNQLIAAVLAAADFEFDDVSDCPYFRSEGTCIYGCQNEPSCHTDMPRGGWPMENLRQAVAAHRAATATEHVQGPDMDADDRPVAMCRCGRHVAATPCPEHSS